MTQKKLLPNFGGLKNQDFEKAKVVIIPAGYEASVTYGGGTAKGPRAILGASTNLDELWDVGYGLINGLAETDIYTVQKDIAGKIKEPLPALKNIEKQVVAVVEKNKLPVLLGGEHTVTLGALQGLRGKYGNNFCVLHFDAHTDLLDQYEGNNLNHGCVIRRARELGLEIVSVGIRNMNAEIADYIKKHKLEKDIFYGPALPMDKIFKRLDKKNIYISFDFDALDPAIMPSTGTPEPGGLGWHETLNLLRKVCGKYKIIGADFVELAPISDLHAPDFLAAKLIYHFISYIFGKP